MCVMTMIFFSSNEVKHPSFFFNSREYIKILVMHKRLDLFFVFLFYANLTFCQGKFDA